MAQQALQLIEEDGTTISFPVVVENMRDNLTQVAAFLEQQATGIETQTLQHEIERTLEELIEALQIAKKSGSGSGQGKPGNCKPALLPDTAELKLLRALQLRVNRRTRSFDQRLNHVLDAGDPHRVDQIATGRLDQATEERRPGKQVVQRGERAAEVVVAVRERDKLCARQRRRRSHPGNVWQREHLPTADPPCAECHGERGASCHS